jgi:hypothetical protein
MYVHNYGQEFGILRAGLHRKAWFNKKKEACSQYKSNNTVTIHYSLILDEHM